uniref:Protein phosphatase 1D n=1 Tax=Ciona intestinalis TaxID=7719 RepID=F6Y7N9_CIOIN|nr:protein phosphatase 1D isoform X1 [Ciona intestinalis]|eukprot:XP_002127750.1 protein phosphatase 1D isoform X1 [Ciona intestinalis]
MPTNCWNLRVTAEVNQGCRKYMEDVISVQFERVKSGKVVLEYAAFAIFDGHGGKDAAHFAKDHLLENIKVQKGFFSKDAETVKKAISDAFVSTHHAMWNKLPEWPKTGLGHPSTAGTTASLVIIRGNLMYVANVGDSMIVMGSRDVCDKSVIKPKFIAKDLTIDHKPELYKERSRIERCGGCVMNKAGVNRVVWSRPKISHTGPIRRSTKIDKIPFLAVARSLGDLWSFNSELNEFVVSPVPDVYVYKLHENKEQFVVLASDGLWNMVRPQESVNLVGNLEDERKRVQESGDTSTTHTSPAHQLVQTALERWEMRMMRADNTSVIVVIIERRQMEQTRKRDTYFETWTSAADKQNTEPSTSESKETVKPPPPPYNDNNAKEEIITIPKPEEQQPATVDPPTPTPTEVLQDSSISSSSGEVTDDPLPPPEKMTTRSHSDDQPTSSGISDERAVTRSRTHEAPKQAKKRRKSEDGVAIERKSRRLLRSTNKRRAKSDGGAMLLKSPPRLMRSQTKKT